MHPDQMLSVSIHGQGPCTIVFGNGFSTSQQSWEQILPYVPPSWRVVQFDYVGTTPATTPHWLGERYRTYEGHADDVRRLLQEHAWQPVLFVAHSMSGMIGALTASMAPGLITELFMIGASPCYIELDTYPGGFARDAIEGLLRSADADLAAWMAGFGPLALGDQATSHQLSEYRDTLLAIRPDIGRTLMRSIFESDYRDLVPRIPCPVTIIQSADDVAVPLPVGEWLAQRTRCIEHRVLPVRGHLPHITHPALIGPLIRSTCERMESANAGTGSKAS